MSARPFASRNKQSRMEGACGIHCAGFSFHFSCKAAQKLDSDHLHPLALLWDIAPCYFLTNGVTGPPGCAWDQLPSI